ncbi:ATP-binding protein [Streptomyces sp. NPDC003011]
MARRGARRAHRRTGRLVRLDGDGTVIHGPGIDAADTARVFDRFCRADTARALPGSGLGPAVVREVAGTHGSTVFAGPRAGGGAAVGSPRMSHGS